ncbi:MAG: helix-turn-helix domain-containing protein [Lachnospiraceae bacterium]|nr:helix-turn-helix domain-containing protein [Lachnospiraceae bacterium]
MEEISKKVGDQIKKYRKEQKMTLQTLADKIHKSRATMCKYENGEIAIDVNTLYEISCALHVPASELMNAPLPENVQPDPGIIAGRMGQSPFFKSKRLYFYFYDGRYNHLKDGIINIGERDPETGDYSCTLSICIMSPDGRSSEIYYTGTVIYSDMLIRFSFINSCNKLEEALLYIFNPLEQRDQTLGLLCSISTADLVPCSFKCLLSLTPQEATEEFRKQLLFTDAEMKRMKKLNRLLVTNI